MDETAEFCYRGLGIFPHPFRSGDLAPRAVPSGSSDERCCAEIHCRVLRAFSVVVAKLTKRMCEGGAVTWL